MILIEIITFLKEGKPRKTKGEKKVAEALPKTSATLELVLV